MPDFDRELAVVAEAWPTLSEPIRRAILSLVDTCREQRDDGSARACAHDVLGTILRFKLPRSPLCGVMKTVGLRTPSSSDAH